MRLTVLLDVLFYGFADQLVRGLTGLASDRTKCRAFRLGESNMSRHRCACPLLTICGAFACDQFCGCTKSLDARGGTRPFSASTPLARVPARRGPSEPGQRQPRKWFAEIRAAPRPVRRQSARHRKAGGTRPWGR